MQIWKEVGENERKAEEVMQSNYSKQNVIKIVLLIRVLFFFIGIKNKHKQNGMIANTSIQQAKISRVADEDEPYSFLPPSSDLVQKSPFLTD